MTEALSSTRTRPLARAGAGLCSSLLMLAVADPALAGIELAREKSCLACHAVDRKLIGPAFRSVAYKYANAPGALATLTQRILQGSAGVWGQVRMPANPQVDPTEASILARWILTIK